MDEQTQLPNDNPLLLWVAYLPVGEKKNYLSDGNGHIRIFKSEVAINEWLDANTTSDVRMNVVVHSVQGTIALPAEDYSLSKGMVTPATMDEVSTVTMPPLYRTALDAPPSNEEVLQTLIKHRRRNIK